MLHYLQPNTSTKLWWEATEIVQIAVHHIQCTFDMSKALNQEQGTISLEHESNLRKMAFKTLGIITCNSYIVIFTIHPYINEWALTWILTLFRYKLNSQQTYKIYQTD